MNYDKEKLKKLAISFVGFAIMITGIMVITSITKHEPFRPNIAGIIVASALCAGVITFVPKIWR